MGEATTVDFNLDGPDDSIRDTETGDAGANRETGDAGAQVDTDAVFDIDEAVEQSGVSSTLTQSSTLPVRKSTLTQSSTETKRPGTCWFPHACVRSLVWVAAVSTSVTRLLHVCECEAAAKQLRNVSTFVTAAAKQLRKQVHVCYTSVT